jgi:phosphatidylinositol glycan class B
MSFSRINVLLAALVFATAAWFGVGFQSEDEFHQVISVAQHMRGEASAEDQLMDFHAHWRSSLLPVIAAGVFEAGDLVGLTNPFTRALILRLITGALALGVLRDLARVVKPMLRTENHQALDALNWFLWFVPILLMRFTGEAWSALLFARGLTLLLDEKPRNAWAIGAWWGVAMVIRPAVAVLPLSAWVWALLVKKEERARLTRMAGGGVIAIVACTALDSICYGTFTMPLWNYFAAALGGQENARFMTLPWYQYGLFTIKHATVPVGVLLIAAFVIVLALNRRHVLVWLLLPFLLAHSIMPIKEPRFLFPLAVLMPWLLVAAWDTLCCRWPVAMRRKLWLQLLFPFAAVNLLALLVAMLTPAGNGRIRLAQEIRSGFGDEPVHIDLMGDWRQNIPAFYLSAKSTEAFVDQIVPDAGKPIHLVIAAESEGLDQVSSLQRIATGAPRWSHRYLRWYGLEDGHDPLVLYRLETGVIDH